MIDDYDDELPSISVTRSRQSRIFFMPSAAALAHERARENQCEREIQELAAKSGAAETTLGAVGATVAAVSLAAQHNDSSGSEGEAALAAAVLELRVRSPHAAPHLPRLPALLRALEPHLTPRARVVLQPYQQHQWQPQLLEHTLNAIESALCEEEREWDEDEALAVGALLLAGSAARVGGRRWRRALHALLDNAASGMHAAALEGAVEGATRGEGRTALEAGDAARSGAGAGADALAAQAWRGALWSQARCGALGAEAQYCALQAAGRALALRGSFTATEERAQALHALRATTSVPSHDRHAPDALKVRVAASRLQLLFQIND